ncbi:MAG: glycoside hydrolase family 99-like domain-containing protein, partial [Armatimonadota bacterium]
MIRCAQFACVALFLFAASSRYCAATEYNVGVYYYPWYGDGNFHGPGVIGDNTIRWHLVPQQLPTLGWYNSHDASVVSSHFIWARSAGVDFFACSYWGSWDDTASTIKNCMLPNPDIGNLKLAVFFEPSITSANSGTETEYLCDNFFNDQGYYRVDGKPVVFIYNALTFSDAELAAYVGNMRTAARNKGIGELYLVGDEAYGNYPRTSPTSSSAYRCGLFNAITAYNPYGQLRKLVSSTAKYMTSSNLNTWKSNNDSWRNLAHTAGVDFFPSVEPGFNDTQIRTTHTPMSRKMTSESGAAGSLFSGMLDRAKLN